MATVETSPRGAVQEVDLKGTVIRAGRVDLQPRELRLLEDLMRSAGRVVTRTMLLENVWEFHVDPRTICRRDPYRPPAWQGRSRLRRRADPYRARALPTCTRPGSCAARDFASPRPVAAACSPCFLRRVDAIDRTARAVDDTDADQAVVPGLDLPVWPVLARPGVEAS